MRKQPALYRKLAGVLTCACLFLLPVAAQAQLVITDCFGFTRAIQNVDPGSLSNVQVNVSDAFGSPLNGAEMTLTNSVTGEISTAVVQNGVASFPGVAPGTFSVTTAATGASVGSVSISAASAGIIAAGTATAVGAGVLGGAGVAAVAVGQQVNSAVQGGGNEEEKSSEGGGNGGSGSGGEAAASPTPDPGEGLFPGPTAAPGTSNPGGAVSSSPTPTPTPEDCGNCDPGEEAPSLSEEEFFRKKTQFAAAAPAAAFGGAALVGSVPLSPHR